MTVPNDAAGQFLASNQGAFPESRIVGLGIVDPLLSTYRAAWNSQPAYWQSEMGALFLSQPDNWVLAQLTALPAPLAVKAIGYVGPNAPALPQYDTMWYDDQHETWKRWNGSAWVTQSGTSSGVASVNGGTGVVIITAASISALSTASLGVSAASLDGTGVVPAAQSRVQSVAGRTGVIVLAAADVSGVISTASYNVSGGVPQLDGTGHLSVAQMPAGYTGGGGGGAVTSVAGRTGVITLAVADVANAAAVDPTTSKLLLSLVPARFAVTLTQSGTATVGRINPGGNPAPYSTTLAYVIVTASRPPLGSTASVLARVRAHSTQSFTSLATVPIPALTRRVVTSVNTVVTNGDSLYADVQAVGTTEAGGDYTVQYIGVGAATPPTALAAPGSPTLLTTSAQVSGSITVGWTAPTTGGPVSTYHVYRTAAGGPLTWVGDVDAGTTTFVDTGLTAGVSYVYSVSASNDDAASVAIGATAYTYLLNSTQLASDFVIYLGTNSGTAATLSGTTLSVTSGNVGGSTNGNAQDPVLLKWAGSTALYSAIRWTFPITFAESATDLVQLYLSTNDFTAVNTALTNGVQIQFGPLAFRVGVKAPSYNGGSFYITTASTTSPVQSSPVGNSAGNISWTVGTLATATKYYVTAELLVTDTSGGATNGQALLNVYLATAVGSPVLQGTVTLSATQRSAIAIGRSFLVFLGLQATTGTSTHYTIPTSGSDFVITPLSAPGT